MAAMANDPSIEEILASLDKLLEDSDIGNDDAAASTPAADTVTETPDDDMLDMDALFEEPEESAADSGHDDRAVDPTIDDDDVLNQEIVSNAISGQPLQDNETHERDQTAPEPLETDLAAAVQAFNRGECEEKAVEKTSETIDSESEAVKDMADKASDHEAEIADPSAALSESPTFPEPTDAMMDAPDADTQTEAGIEHHAAVNVPDASSFVAAEVTGDETASSDEASVEQSDASGDTTEPEEGLAEQAPIRLTADQEVVADLPEVVSASIEDAYRESEAVAPDEPVPEFHATESDTVADQAEDKPLTTASKSHANIVVLSEAMLIDDHQNPLPFDRSIPNNHDEPDGVVSDVSDKPALAEESELAEEKLPTSMPDALIEAISDKVARQIEASLPALIEAGVQKAMKKAQKKHVRKKKSGKK